MALGRDFVLYLEPKDPKNTKDFAQCKTCGMWTGTKGDQPNRCHGHGDKVKVTGDMSCGFYGEGKPMPGGELMKFWTPKESGLVKRKVRCENCEAFNGINRCEFFKKMNRKMGVNLNTKVKPCGCCNAQQPKKDNIKKLRMV